MRLWFLLSLSTFLLFLGLTYAARAVYNHYEGASISVAQAFLFVVETMTTTGYGELLPFHSWQMTIFSVFVMLAGFGIIFVGIVTLASEWLKERFQPLPPVEAPPRLKGHVILTAYNAMVESLVSELRRRRVPFLVVNPDRELVTRLMRDGVPAIEADPSLREGLVAGHFAQARSLLAAGDDEENASVVIEAKAYGDVPVISLIEREENTRALQYAGADQVISPKQVLGEELARWALSALSTRLRRETRRLTGIELREFPVVTGSPLSGRSVADVDLRAKTGVTLLGYWYRGIFSVVEDPYQPLPEHCVVMLAGTEAQIQRAAKLMLQSDRPLRTGEGEVIVAGYGTVGQQAVAVLRQNGRSCRVIDKLPGLIEGQVVGDATEEDDLAAAGLADAGTIVVALDQDAQTIYTTLVARRLSSSVRVLARCKSIHNIDKLYRAGADAVLSLSEFGGQMLASLVVDGGDKDLRDHDIAFLEWRVGEALSGKTISESMIYTRFGVLIVGIGRTGESWITNPRPGAELHKGDGLIVMGNRDSIEAFKAAHPEGATAS